MLRLKARQQYVGDPEVLFKYFCLGFYETACLLITVLMHGLRLRE